MPNIGTDEPVDPVVDDKQIDQRIDNLTFKLKLTRKSIPIWHITIC